MNNEGLPDDIPDLPDFEFGEINDDKNHNSNLYGDRNTDNDDADDTNDNNHHDDEDDEDDEEDLQEKLMLKRNILDSVADICQREAKKNNRKVSLRFLHGLTDVVFHTIGVMAKDTEAFARHAKRTQINVDDVLLYIRRNPSATKLLQTYMNNNNIVKRSGMRKKRSSSSASKAQKKKTPILDDDQEDDR